MPLYECTFITRPDIPVGEVNKYIEKFSGIITENGGKVVKTEYWGLRNLAYRIKKNKKGHYAMLAVEAPAPAVKEMERTMGITEDLMRQLTVRVEAISEEPSAVMQQRAYGDTYSPSEESERGERGERGDRGDREQRTETTETQS